MEGMKNPEFIEKVQTGPVAFMTIVPNGPPTIGSSLVLWFFYSIVVSVFGAYIAGRALPAGASHLAVIRFAGCTAFAGHWLALQQNSIWYKRNWVTAFYTKLPSNCYERPWKP
jgi:hypothetical protein